MSIIIKGLDMPKNCLECRLGDGAMCEVMGKIIKEPNTIADFCPLVEIPTPHGMLIDVDDLINHIYDCPTILEAEE